MNLEGQLWRPVRDLIAHRLSQSRGSQWGRHLQWSAQLPLGDALAADSLDLIESAEAVLRFFPIGELGWEDALLIHRSIDGWASVAAAALAHVQALQFSSSGSQGSPVLHRHSLQILKEEAMQLASIIGPRQRLVCAVPTHHIYGFIFGVLLPQQLQCAVLDACGLPPSALARQLRPGDLLVAHPMLWSQLAELPLQWPEDVTGVSSTAPLDPEAAHRLAAHGLGRLVEVYGSSETAGIGWRDTPERPFALLPRWQGVSVDALIAVDGCRFDLPDRVESSGRFIRPEGRRDRAVQVAGVNVYPDRIARMLEQAPGVASAQVRLDTSSGRLKALLVATTDADLDEQNLRAWCIARLSAPECPSRFVIASEPPVTVMGKAADW